MDIKDLDLTEEDFTLIMKALEFLPSSGMAGDLMGVLLGSMLPDDRNARAKFEAIQKAKERDRALKVEALVEDVRILQGKLLYIKRQLMQAGALRQAGDALKPRS